METFSALRAQLSFACGQNIKKVNCLNWGSAGKKVHICDVLATTVTTRVQIVLKHSPDPAWRKKVDLRPPPEPDVLGYGKIVANLLFRSVVLSAELNLRLLAEDRSVFLDLFDPLDPLCSCGIEGANHESVKELQTPRPMSSAGMMNSCYPLLLAHCCSVFLEAAAV